MGVDDVTRAAEPDVPLPPDRIRALEAGEVDADYIEILELLRLYDADEEAFGRELLASFPELRG